jgi:hypothetical protein
MKILLFAVLLIVVPSVVASPDELPRGEWHNTDLRGIEALPGGRCVRLWLEERTYNIVPTGESRFTGNYFNVIRAAPVGLPSREGCRFPPPADNPVANQIRGWLILGNKTPEQAWRVRAEPGMRGGDLRDFKSEEFETKLYRRGEYLVDSTGGGENPDEALFFRPPAPSPAAARAALEDTIRRLHEGACLEVLSTLVPTLDAAREMCTLRQRMAEITGSLLSISVDGVTELDRVPVGFPRTPSKGHRRQRGVFFSFMSNYEQQQIPGNAVVFEEEGAWKVVVLWF